MVAELRPPLTHARTYGGITKEFRLAESLATIPTLTSEGVHMRGITHATILLLLLLASTGDQLNVTLSIGVAASPPCNPDGPALEVYAKNGLKQAKRMGKNRVVVSASN